MKKLIAVLLVVAMMACMMTGCGSSSSTSSSDFDASEYGADVQAIVDSGVLKVGVKNNVEGFGFQDVLTGDYAGLEIDLAEKIAAELGVEVEYTTVTAATRTELLDSGDLDCVIATFTVTDERKLSWDFTTAYYVDAVTVLVEDSSNITDLSGLVGKTVGVSSGSTSAKAVVVAMIEAGLISADSYNADTFDAATWTTNVSFRQYDDYPSISLALSAGEVDAFSVDKSILSIYKTEGRSFIEENFSPQDYGIATAKDSGLSTLCEEFVTEWLADGTMAALISANGIE
ncbi:MAG: transporter substrate-binding domain-containing protein [Bacillota bacterium]